MAACPTCEQVMVDVDSCTPRPDSILYGTEVADVAPEDYTERCPDCEVTQGGAHHTGCCVEWCAGCNAQRLTCGCDE
jgi:hypothetical protein